MRKSGISILVNDIDEYVLENIKKIVKDYKKVNIVTNHIEKFKNLEEHLLEERGIVLSISNNKRKSLLNSQIILNVDFPTELINKYRIYEEAIIVNFRCNVKITQKRFNGLNINDYEISFSNEENQGDKIYAKKDIYEAQIYKNQPPKYIEKILKEDKVQIIKLFGCNNLL